MLPEDGTLVPKHVEDTSLIYMYIWILCIELLQKIEYIVLKIVQNGLLWFSTLFTRAHPLCLAWVTLIQTMPLQPIFKMHFILHYQLDLRLPSGLWRFPYCNLVYCFRNVVFIYLFVYLFWEFSTLGKFLTNVVDVTRVVYYLKTFLKGPAWQRGIHTALSTGG